MGDAEKTTILAATPYGYDDEDDWDDEEDARRRKRRIIAIVAVLAVLLISGITAALLLTGDPEEPAVQQVAVPGLINQDQATAEAALRDVGLEVGEITQEPSAADQVGKVISSDPAGGQRVDEGTAVSLVIGTGPDAITVPNVVGLSEEEARANLENAGFNPASISTREVDSLEAEGRVVSVTPNQGQPASPDQAIILGISKGTLELPDVQGRSRDEAHAMLVEAGFSEGQIVDQSVERDDVAEGTVVETSPGPNSSVGADQEITLLIAVPVPPQQVPTTTPSVPSATASSSATASPTP